MSICRLSKTVVVIALAAFAFSAVGASAAVVFAEDFESPVVTGYDEGTTPSSWVRANNGFGSGQHGIINEDSGTFVDPAGEQAYTFRYTNSGITTDVELIGALTGGWTYNISFDVVLDGGTVDPNHSGTPYSAGLLTFADGAARNSVTGVGDQASAVLASVSGDAPGDGSYHTISFSYTSDGTQTTSGEDLAFRFAGGTNTANVDNLVINAIPEPASALLLVAAMAGVGLLRRKFQR